MTVKIIKVHANQDEYGEGDDLRVNVLMGNELAEEATVILEAVMMSRNTSFPTSMQRIGVRLGANEQRDVTLYNIKIDERFKVDEYTVYVTLAKQLGEGSAGECAFEVVKAKDIL
jgi:uncharacterized membrane protein